MGLLSRIIVDDAQVSILCWISPQQSTNNTINRGYAWSKNRYEIFLKNAQWWMASRPQTQTTWTQGNNYDFRTPGFVTTGKVGVSNIWIASVAATN